jgi:hypothetical protein
MCKWLCMRISSFVFQHTLSVPMNYSQQETLGLLRGRPEGGRPLAGVRRGQNEQQPPPSEGALNYVVTHLSALNKYPPYLVKGKHPCVCVRMRSVNRCKVTSSFCVRTINTKNPSERTQRRLDLGHV